jgi:AmmeMemoRadiSam system protein A
MEGGGSGLRIKTGNPLEPWEISDEEGELLVRAARWAIESLFDASAPGGAGPAPPKLYRPGAAFVTIEKLRGASRQLRGCIGFFRPTRPLIKVVEEAAVEAALNDPRFPPLGPEEVDRVVVEVSVLSSPVELSSRPDERIREVRVGRDGLIVSRPPYVGLLLPQVAVDQGWDEVVFLTEACIKAGLEPTCWTERTTKVYKFTATVWAEAEPRGPVKVRMRAQPYSLGQK